MKRRAFLQNKLWRDQAVQMLEAEGSVIHWNKLSDADYDRELRLKLLEEAKEVDAARTREELRFEIADVLEVLECLCSVNGLSMEDVYVVKEKKNIERGSFHGRKFVTIAEHPEGSFGERYCLKDPEKYPELKNQ